MTGAISSSSTTSNITTPHSPKPSVLVGISAFFLFLVVDTFANDYEICLATSEQSNVINNKDEIVTRTFHHNAIALDVVDRISVETHFLIYCR